MMDHSRIEGERIVDRYLARRLDGDDEALFEEHLFECSECLEKVTAGEQLRLGLREVAAQDAARAVVAQEVVSLGLLAWLRRRRPAELAAIAGLALAVVVMPVVLLVQNAELGRLRQAAGHGVAGVGGVAGLARPTADVLVVSLGVVRGAGDQVAIRPGGEQILLSLELQEITSATYRATLSGESGEVLWQGEDLEPNLYDSLLIAVPSSFLPPGSYRVSAQASAETAAEEVYEVAFRVLPREK